MKFLSRLLFHGFRPAVIAPGRVDRRVAGQLLHGHQIHAPVQQVADKRPAEVMRRLFSRLATANTREVNPDRTTQCAQFFRQLVEKARSLLEYDAKM
jgi:hypothetical protein